MNGYPPGTKCVVTWVPSWIRGRVGQIVVVAEHVYRWRGNVPDPDGKFYPQADGLIVQRLSDPKGSDYPVAWMRPLQDPDPETIEEHDEVTA